MTIKLIIDIVFSLILLFFFVLGIVLLSWKILICVIPAIIIWVVGFLIKDIKEFLK